MTKKISIAEYGSKQYYDSKSYIKKLVDREAEIWHANDPKVELPKYKEIKVDRELTAGLWNICRQMLP